MIRVTLELVSARDGHTEVLGVGYISNDGAGTPARGNYNVRLMRRGRGDILWKTGRVEDFPRKRLLGWDLLYRALRATLGDRNG
jgi:hypothetical protein